MKLLFRVDDLLTSISNIREIKEIFILTQIFCSLSNDIDIMAETKKEFGIAKENSYEKSCTRGLCSTHKKSRSEKRENEETVK